MTRLESLVLQKFPYKLQQIYNRDIPTFHTHLSENYVFGLIPKASSFKALKKFKITEIFPEYINMATFWLVSWIQDERWLTIRVSKDFSTANLVSSSFGWMTKLSSLWKNRKLLLYDTHFWLEIDTTKMYFI